MTTSTSDVNADIQVDVDVNVDFHEFFKHTRQFYVRRNLLDIAVTFNWFDLEKRCLLLAYMPCCSRHGKTLLIVGLHVGLFLNIWKNVVHHWFAVGLSSNTWKNIADYWLACRVVFEHMEGRC